MSKSKSVPKRKGDKPMKIISITIEPDKLKQVNIVAGKRGRSRFIDEAIDLLLGKVNVFGD